MGNIQITPIQTGDYHDLSIMVGELLHEIMEKTNVKAFNYNQEETKKRSKNLVSRGKYWVFIAKNDTLGINVGFVSLYESYALYSEGAYGTMPELYVRPDWRSESIGKTMLREVQNFAVRKGWHRIEVTTPPLPEYERTLRFYQANGFEISGGKKLKLGVQKHNKSLNPTCYCLAAT